MITQLKKQTYVGSGLGLFARLSLIYVCVLTFFSTPLAWATSQKDDALTNLSISICDDANEWPPYIYAERIDGKKSNKIVGFSIDVIEDIFSRNRLRYTIAMVPWSRCLLEVEHGNKYQMILDITTSPEREKTYWITRPYYTTNTHYFYSKKQFPKGVSIQAMAELKKYRLCGIHGYNVNYTGYIGLFAPGEIDQGAKDYRALIAKLHLKRCDLFLEQYQAMLGYALIGDPILDDPNLASEPMPGLAPTAFRLAISRQFSHGAKLTELIDRELAQMEKSGRLKELWQKRVAK